MTAAAMDRTPVPMPGPDLSVGTGEYFPPFPAPERRLGALEQRITPVRDILDREGYHLPPPQRVDPWLLIIASGVLVALGLALLAVWASGVDVAEAPTFPPAAPSTATTPSPYGLSATEHGAALTAELLGVHGGGAR